MLWSLGDHPFYFPGEVQLALADNDASWGQRVRAASVALFGERELARRLPGVISTLLAAGCAGLLGARWRDGVTGLIGALAILLMPWCAAWARVAVDMALIVGWVCIPMALALAVVARRWLDDDAPRKRGPFLMNASAVGLTIIFGVALGGLLIPAARDAMDMDRAIVGPMLRLVLQGMVCVAGAWAAVALYRHPLRRAWSMILMAASLACLVTLGLSVEDALTRKNSIKMLLAELDSKSHEARGLLVVGIDPKPFAYEGADRWTIGQDADLIVAQADQWQAMMRDQPQWIADYEKLMDWRRPFERYEVWIRRELVRADDSVPP